MRVAVRNIGGEAGHSSRTLTSTDTSRVYSTNQAPIAPITSPVGIGTPIAAELKWSRMPAILLLYCTNHVQYHTNDFELLYYYDGKVCR